MSRLLLLLPAATYRARDFLDAAARLDAEVVVASDHRQTLAGVLGDRALHLDLCRPHAAARAIADLAERTPLDAVVAVDDPGVAVAALAAEELGLAHNPPAAVAMTRNKAAARRAFADAGLSQPAFRIVEQGARVEPAAAAGGLPCV
ncbi:MAG: biotin carboxylase, partial [Gaiellales bacterium]